MVASSNPLLSDKIMMMRAIISSGYGDNIDELLSVQDDIVPVPQLKDIPNKKKRNDSMIIQTLAIALAPGDGRVLSGKTKEVQGPSSLPYVPGGDCCGIIKELPENYNEKNIKKGSPIFRVGDYVGCGFTDKPFGAGSDYCIVSIKNSALVPSNIDPIDAASLVSSNPAIELCESSKIKSTDRILVLGASGGMGSIVCQLLRNVYNVSYLVGVTSHVKQLKELNVCHDIIDYKEIDVYSIEKYQQNKFDMIIDLAGAHDGGYQRLIQDFVTDKKDAKKYSIIKSNTNGGRFITTVGPAGPIFEAHNMWQILNIYLFPVLNLVFKSRWYPTYYNTIPKYSMSFALTFERTAITKIFQYATSGNIKAITDPQGPFPYTSQDVRDAFKLLDTRHAFGKVVIDMRSNNNNIEKK